MRLVTFRLGGESRVGVVVGDEVADIGAVDPRIAEMVDLIAAGSDRLAELAASAAPVARLDDVQLLAPVRPKKNVFAVGRNYLEHVREVPGPDSATRPPPENPIIFTKPPTSIIGPGEAIVTANDPSGTTDYEGELAVVIGRPGKRIPAPQAWDHVFGYTILNDVTARALQRKHVQWVIGKGPDTFCPMGPWIVTVDALPDVTRSEVRTEVNGELRQRGSVADLIFDIPTLIATLSRVMTLEPGDVIATGTPSGVGAGFDPPRYLWPGDVVSVSVDGIGTLTNPVI